jgi:hypothetical protein
MDPAQRAALLGVKLRALINGQWGVGADELVAAPYHAGAAYEHQPTSTLYVLIDVPQVDRDPMDLGDDTPVRPPRGWLGGALVIASRRGCAQVHVMGEDLDGNDARRAGHAAVPVGVWKVHGRDLHPVEALAHVPAALPPAVVLLLEEQMRAAGCVPVIDHGVLRAEVLGLEVGRAAIDPETGEAWLEVGVGRHDRLAQAMMHQGQDPVEALRNAGSSVLQHRRAGAMAHPANHLALSRWLREAVLARPEMAGLSPGTELTRVPGTEPPELKRMGPALLFDDRGNGTLVACSVGVDLDAPVDAVDAAAFLGAERVVLCIPPGDDLPAVRTVAGSLDVPLDVIVAPPDWQA